MQLYLDMCALKRPFDDRSQPSVEAEARAVLEVLWRIQAGIDSFVWSAALTFENEADPDAEVREVITELGSLAVSHVRLTLDVEERIADLSSAGLAVLDAAHLALAEAADCDFLLTCDQRFAKRARRANVAIRVANPLEYLEEISHDKPVE